MCYSSAGRVCVALIIIALVVIGFAFCVIGIFPIRQTITSAPYKELSTTTQNLQYFTLAAGLLALLVCAVSLCGICVILWFTESRCLFYWLALLVVAAIIFDIVLIIQVVATKARVRSFLEDKFYFYGISPGPTRIMDFFQKEFNCCGVDGPEDYTSRGLEVPLSCCPLQVSTETDQPTGHGEHFSDLFRDREGNGAEPKFRSSIANDENKIMSDVLGQENHHTNTENVTSEEKNGGKYKVNFTSRIEFDLPPKNISDPPVTGGGGGGGGGAGGSTAQPCSGCYTKILAKYNTYLILFYFLIAAKMLLEFCVGVSPCWVMLREKYDNYHPQPYNQDGASYDTVDSRP